MPRYTRQHDRFRCGPVAIANSLKWAGARVNYRKYKFFLDNVCDVHPPVDHYLNGFSGTAPKDAGRTLRTLSHNLLHVQEVRRPKLSQIREHLDSGGAVLIHYYWRIGKVPITGHYALLTGRDPETDVFTCVNVYKYRTISRLCNRRMRSHILQFHNSRRFGVTGFFLTRRQKFVRGQKVTPGG